MLMPLFTLYILTKHATCLCFLTTLPAVFCQPIILPKYCMVCNYLTLSSCGLLWTMSWILKNVIVTLSQPCSCVKNINYTLKCSKMFGYCAWLDCDKALWLGICMCITSSRNQCHGPLQNSTAHKQWYKYGMHLRY